MRNHPDQKKRRGSFHQNSSQSQMKNRAAGGNRNTKKPTGRLMTAGFSDKQKAIMRHYHRLLKKEQAQAGAGSSQAQQISDSIHINKKRMKLTAFQRAKMEFEAKEEERRAKREELEKQAKEREEALKKYRKEKFKKFHKLTQKTKKGQPVMKGRIEVLLDKIKKDMANDCG